MWPFISSRPTFQIDGGTMNIFARNLAEAGDDLIIEAAEPAMTNEGARPSFGAARTGRPLGASLRVGFAACFRTPIENQFTEHWVLFPSFRSPRIAIEGALKRPVNTLILESAEPKDVLPGGWEDELEFLQKVREFMDTEPEARYIHHVRTDSVGFVP